MSSMHYFRLMAVTFGIAGIMPGAVPAAASDASTQARVVTTVEKIGGRDGRAGEATRHVRNGLVTQGARSDSAGKTSASVQKSGSEDFWFFRADVVLFGDDDNDGYFHGIDLLFDADTIYDVVDVYAVTYLSLNGGPWNEYAVSNTFTIYGASSDDEYVIVTELESGYPTGSYDLLIELYDAVDGSYLAEYGPADTAELSYLPLEDYKLDAPYVEEIVVIEHGGGGAGTALLGLLLLPLLRRAAGVSRQHA